MKITYIITSIIPSKFANSVHAMKMCSAISKNHEIELVIPRRNDIEEKDVADVYKFYGVDKTFKITKVPFIKKVGVFILALMGCMIAKKNKSDLVFTREVVTAYFSTLFGIPTIFETHSPFISERSIEKYFFKKAMLSNSTLKVIVISQALKDIILENWPMVSADKIMVAHDGADIPNELPSKITKIQKIGYVGHLYKGRGIDLIVDVARKLPDHEFHIIGGHAEDITYWKDETKELSNIVFHGFVAPSEAERLRSEMDVLLAPYQDKVFVKSGMNTVKWMSPLKVFEYMASGRPIICSKLSVLQEVLNNENSILCDPNNSDEWVDGIKKLEDDISFANKISTQTYNDLKDHYSWFKRSVNILESIN